LEVGTRLYTDPIETNDHGFCCHRVKGQLGKGEGDIGRPLEACVCEKRGGDLACSASYLWRRLAKVRQRKGVLKETFTFVLLEK